MMKQLADMPRGAGGGMGLGGGGGVGGGAAAAAAHASRGGGGDGGGSAAPEASRGEASEWAAALRGVAELPTSATRADAAVMKLVHVLEGNAASPRAREWYGRTPDACDAITGALMRALARLPRGGGSHALSVAAHCIGLLAQYVPSVAGALRVAGAVDAMFGLLAAAAEEEVELIGDAVFALGHLAGEDEGVLARALPVVVAAMRASRRSRGRDAVIGIATFVLAKIANVPALVPGFLSGGGIDALRLALRAVAAPDRRLSMLRNVTGTLAGVLATREGRAAMLLEHAVATVRPTPLEMLLTGLREHPEDSMIGIAVALALTALPRDGPAGAAAGAGLRGAGALPLVDDLHEARDHIATTFAWGGVTGAVAGGGDVDEGQRAGLDAEAMRRRIPGHMLEELTMWLEMGRGGAPLPGARGEEARVEAVAALMRGVAGLCELPRCAAALAAGGALRAARGAVDGDGVVVIIVGEGRGRVDPRVLRAAADLVGALHRVAPRDAATHVRPIVAAAAAAARSGSGSVYSSVGSVSISSITSSGGGCSSSSVWGSVARMVVRAAGDIVDTVLEAEVLRALSTFADAAAAGAAAGSASGGDDDAGPYADGALCGAFAALARGRGAAAVAAVGAPHVARALVRGAAMPNYPALGAAAAAAAVALLSGGGGGTAAAAAAGRTVAAVLLTSAPALLEIAEAASGSGDAWRALAALAAAAPEAPLSVLVASGAPTAALAALAGDHASDRDVAAGALGTLEALLDGAGAGGGAAAAAAAVCAASPQCLAAVRGAAWAAPRAARRIVAAVTGTDEPELEARPPPPPAVKQHTDAANTRGSSSGGGGGGARGADAAAAAAAAGDGSGGGGGTGACDVCGGPAEQRCARCRGVWYCGPKCQRAAWPTHKAVCKKPGEGGAAAAAGATAAGVSSSAAPKVAAAGAGAAVAAAADAAASAAGVAARVWEELTGRARDAVLADVREVLAGARDAAGHVTRRCGGAAAGLAAALREAASAPRRVSGGGGAAAATAVCTRVLECILSDGGAAAVRAAGGVPALLRLAGDAALGADAKAR